MITKMELPNKCLMELELKSKATNPFDKLTYIRLVESFTDSGYRIPARYMAIYDRFLK